MRKDMARTLEKKQRSAKRGQRELAMDHAHGAVHDKDLEKVVSRTKAELRNKAKAREELKRM